MKAFLTSHFEVNSYKQRKRKYEMQPRQLQCKTHEGKTRRNINLPSSVFAQNELQCSPSSYERMLLVRVAG